MIQGLILAAGMSSRLGQPKQLLDLNGCSLLELTLMNVLKVTPKVTVLLGAEIIHSLAIVEKIKQNYPLLESIICSTYEEGMGSTLSEGLRLLKGRGSVLIHLVDLPYVNEFHLEALIQQNCRFPEKAIISSFRGQLAPPILIPSHLIPLFKDWKGEKGLGTFWKSNPSLCEFVEFDEDYRDVDTMEDYFDVIGNR